MQHHATTSSHHPIHFRFQALSLACSGDSTSTGDCQYCRKGIPKAGHLTLRQGSVQLKRSNFICTGKGSSSSISIPKRPSGHGFTEELALLIKPYIPLFFGSLSCDQCRSISPQRKADGSAGAGNCVYHMSGHATDDAGLVCTGTITSQCFTVQWMVFGTRIR